MQHLQEYLINSEPFYLVQGDELVIAEAAYEHAIPLLLKGPTGCGKTRFMQHLAWKLKRPLVTVACHDDLSTSDLVGRYQEGEEQQDAQKFSKDDLIFLSGEALPRCWTDPHYRDAELAR